MSNEYNHLHHIPDISLIDLDNDNKEIPPDDTLVPRQPPSSCEEDAVKVEQKKFPSYLIHIVLLAVLLVSVVCILYRFQHWGEKIDLSEIKPDDEVQYMDVLDQILPLTDTEGRVVDTSNPDSIVVFGNAPFADARGTDENLANMIAASTGATVYNCSVSGSYLAAQEPFLQVDVAPMDAYCPYWMIFANLGLHNNDIMDISGAYADVVQTLGSAAPPEASEVYETITTLDFNTVDVVVFMYDASDYLMGHPMYDDNNPTNLQQFTGNLEASIELLQQYYPHIRIIVLSPTYAFALDKKGEYVSSDKQRYGWDVLSTYVIKEYVSCASRSVTFVDNLYGTITEQNAKDYLTDHLHLNQEGREKVLERFLYALNYYNH
ncbi:MAG: SGNH/GDSL hydrolase family protein [Acetatifactor sp.]|nr:SGNH/GDSL hydrolase family protein [Acetatifactor sp.]